MTKDRIKKLEESVSSKKRIRYLVNPTASVDQTYTYTFSHIQQYSYVLILSGGNMKGMHILGIIPVECFPYISYACFNHDNDAITLSNNTTTSFRLEYSVVAGNSVPYYAVGLI